MLNLELKRLDIPRRYVMYLGRAGVSTIGELLARSEDELLSIRNVGVRSLDACRAVLVRLFEEKANG